MVINSAVGIGAIVDSCEPNFGEKNEGKVDESYYLELKYDFRIFTEGIDLVVGEVIYALVDITMNALLIKWINRVIMKNQ